jgi:hypothetical protein
MTKPINTGRVCRNCNKTFPRPGGGKRVFCSRSCAAWFRIQKGEPDECWPFIGAYGEFGYGTFSWGKNTRVRAHRVIYEEVHGPLNGLNVLHKCDNPPCCNPTHLTLGTIAENNADRDRKNRWRFQFGSTHHNAIVTEGDVLAIRARWASGEKKPESLAIEYGVKPSTIRKIVYRVSWKHI